MKVTTIYFLDEMTGKHVREEPPVKNEMYMVVDKYAVAWRVFESVLAAQHEIDVVYSVIDPDNAFGIVTVIEVETE